MKTNEIKAAKSEKQTTISTIATANRLAKLKEALKNSLENVEKLNVYISAGNTKTGAVPSVSLLPVIDCPNCAACARNCYDLRHDLIYNNVIDTRARNSAIWRIDPERYFAEISKACKMFAFFRWHIGGDIVNIDYLRGMVEVANNNKQCKFLAFTKNYSVVNNYIDNGGVIPENLKLIFSDWPGAKLDNKHNLPISSPIFAGGSEGEQSRKAMKRVFCPGNCANCALTECGCWTLKSGEAVLFNAH